MESKRADNSTSFLSDCKAVLKVIWIYAVSVCLIFVVTLSLFPAVTSSVQSMNKDDKSLWTNKYFLPLYCFLLFNVGDLVGRTVAAWVNIPKPKLTIPVCTLVRILFLPLFALCNAQPRHTLPVVFTSDVYPILFMTIFAVSNGYISTQCLMIAPRLVTPKQTELAGVLMAFFMTLGLALGSGLSYLIVLLVTEI